MSYCSKIIATLYCGDTEAWCPAGVISEHVNRLKLRVFYLAFESLHHLSDINVCWFTETMSWLSSISSIRVAELREALSVLHRISSGSQITSLVWEAVQQWSIGSVPSTIHYHNHPLSTSDSSHLAENLATRPACGLWDSHQDLCSTTVWNKLAASSPSKSKTLLNSLLPLTISMCKMPVWKQSCLITC